MRFAALSAALVPLACAAPEAPTTIEVAPPAEVGPELGQRLQQEGWRVAAGREANFSVAWRAAAGEVPRNRDFDLELYVLRAGQPLSGAQVRVRGWMPDHEHGFVRRPHVVEVGEGRYRVEGMLLHMRGFWQVFFDVVHEGKADIVPFEIRL